MSNIFEYVDLGQLKELMDNDDIRDITCLNGVITATSNTKGTYRANLLLSNEEITKIAVQVANKMEKEFNPSSPFLEGEIDVDDYIIRISAFHSYVSPAGTALTLRKVTKENILSENYMKTSGYAEASVLERLKKYVQAGCNILVIGETGSGKTQLVKWLAGSVPGQERIITVEDSMEFQLPLLYPEKNILEVRVREDMTYSEIIAKCLRQNLQWLFLQEARGREVEDLLDGMSNGCHVMTTMHTDESIGVVSRILQMLKLPTSDYDSLSNRIHSLIDVVVSVRKIETQQGIKRFISNITEYDYSNLIPSDHLIWSKGSNNLNKSCPKISYKMKERGIFL
ncbi:ATPase, T2SS/T4P/T4SS family [Holdemania massiliensis]|uniref:ATPase, T2SS/T4P/T4SS family n=1 Tax=Holdemania massiliensis TaxID=1468449 RepID=UPI001F06AB2A|nr:ATPase, T2SS/T4P/T4SS family [Holdemania massiliensis]MCH1942438.1 Flp pilus assembly complex ATPase component TadA [Holdemania massiliensis]